MSRHVSVTFLGADLRCCLFPLRFLTRIQTIFLSILNFIIKSQELFNKTKTCLPRGGNGKSTYWLELSCFRRVS